MKKILKCHFRRSGDYKFQNLSFSTFCHPTPPQLSSTLCPILVQVESPCDGGCLRPWMSINICGADTFMEGTLERLPKISGSVMILDFS